MADQAASPIQVEHGHSRIAHPILEAMPAAGFTASQYAVLLVLIRETFGWGRSDAAVSLTTFEERTGMHRNTLQRAVAALTTEGVVLVRRGASGTASTVYRIQKDPRKWGRHAVEPESLSRAILRQEDEVPVADRSITPEGVTAEGITLEGNTLGGDTLEGNTSVTLEGDTHPSQSVDGGSVTAPERKKETTTTTTAREPADKRTAAQVEMQSDADTAAQRIPDKVRRAAFLASLANLISGDDYTAWRDHTGSQMAWSERPRLLRLAINLFLAGQSRDVRLALTAVVIPQQTDPFNARRSTDRPAQSGSATALPCTTSDIRALLNHAGGSIIMAAYRPMIYRRLESEHPELWARAGPYFQQLDFAAIDDITTKHKGFGLDKNIDEQLSRIAGRLNAA